MSRISIVLLVLCLGLHFSAQKTTAQESTPSAASAPSAGNDAPKKHARPRIGVALEGGGALGFAHIGVLHWFEDHHIPVDYIAGTSMGGLVAGMYATGKTPTEMEDFVRDQNWEAIIAGDTPYADLTYRRKEDLRAFQNSISLGLKHGRLSTPSGLNAGQQVSLVIDEVTLPYSNVASFDELPIPFRCVATDLVSAREVVFSEGSLSKALRATMSIPGVFSPVREGNMVLVDGGLLGNLPTDVVRKMGADIVIAVHLDVSPSNPDQIQSLFGVLGRSIDVVIRENEIRGMAGADLIVNVDLSKYTSMEYAKGQTIIGLGREAAEVKSKVFEPYSLDDAAWQEHLAERKARERHDPSVPLFVKVEGTNAEAERKLEEFLQPLAGKPIDTEHIGTYLTRLTGIGKFDSADYGMMRRNGQDGLVVTVHEKTYAPPILQLGFAVDGSENDDVSFSLLSRLTLMDVAGYRSEWRTDFQFGDTYAVASELYRPFTAASKWFIAPHASASSTSFKIFSKNEPLADYRIYQDSIGTDVGYAVSRFTELRAGYEVGYFDARLRLGTPEFFSFSGRTGDTRAHFQIAHKDDPIAPRDGYSIDTTFQWFDTNPGASGPFPLLQTQVMYFKPITKPASIFVQAEGGTTFSSRRVGVPQFFLGGPARLSAYGTNEFFGNQYYYFRAGYLHDLFTLPPFVGKKVYLFGAYELGKMYGSSTTSALPNDIAAGILAETSMGPLLLGASAGDSGHRKWFFALGHVF